jgi:hypothetical protein
MTQQNTAYGVFVQACWAQHKRQYPDELISKEVEDFNKQCSIWWYNLDEQQRERFQEMADRSNQMVLNQWLDDGHSMTPNLINRIRTLCQQQSNSKVFLCSSVNHYASAGMEDEGWGCGFRNLQMILSSLQSQSAFADALRPILGDSQSIPSIARLQILIEEAWAAGFDVEGQNQLEGQLSNTRKWIGASEVFAVLTANRIKVQLLDFQSEDATHSKLIKWVVDYFQKHSLPQRFPIFLQMKGHSFTIVGVELFPNESQPNLIVFDPSHPKSHMALFYGKGRNDDSLNLLRKTANTLNSNHFQIVAVTGLYNNKEEAAAQKVIHCIWT